MTRSLRMRMRRRMRTMKLSSTRVPQRSSSLLPPRYLHLRQSQQSARRRLSRHRGHQKVRTLQALWILFADKFCERSNTTLAKDAFALPFTHAPFPVAALGSISPFIYRRGYLRPTSSSTDTFPCCYPMHDPLPHGLRRWLHSRLRHILCRKREKLFDCPSTSPRRSGRRQPQSRSSQIVVGESRSPHVDSECRTFTRPQPSLAR